MPRYSDACWAACGLMIAISFWAMCSGTEGSFLFGKICAMIAGMYGGLGLCAIDRSPRR